MTLERRETILGFAIELKDGAIYRLHKKVKREFYDTDLEATVGKTEVSNERAARADLEIILSGEAAMTADKVAELTEAKETADAALAPIQAQLDSANAELEAVRAELNALKNPPAEDTLSAEQFWTAAEIKLGVTKQSALTIVAQMPEGTDEEKVAKVLAKNLIENATRVRKENQILTNLISMVGISSEDFNIAWDFGNLIQY